MSRFLSLLLLLLFSTSPPSTIAQTACIWDTYDFSTVGDVLVRSDGWYYSINFCDPSPYCQGGSMACQFNYNLTETNMLVQNVNEFKLFRNYAGPKLFASEGLWCPVAAQHRVTVVKVVCNLPEVSVVESPPCTYTFSVPSPSGSNSFCPTSSSTTSSRRTSAGFSMMIIGILLLIGILALFAVLHYRQRMRQLKHAYVTTTTIPPSGVDEDGTGATTTTTVSVVPPGDGGVVSGGAGGVQQPYVPVYLQTQPGISPYMTAVAPPAPFNPASGVVYYPGQTVITQ